MPYQKMYSSDEAHGSLTTIKHLKRGHSAGYTASHGEDKQSASHHLLHPSPSSLHVLSCSAGSGSGTLHTHSTHIFSKNSINPTASPHIPVDSSQSRPILPVPDSAKCTGTKSCPSLLTPTSAQATRSKSRSTLTPVVNGNQVRLPEVKQFKTKRQVEREVEEREEKRVWTEKENKGQERKEAKEQRREEKEKTKKLELLRKVNVEAVESVWRRKM
jgi:hypothetical protein